MPEASEFLAGFNLIQGRIFGTYILEHVTSTHESVKRYHEYLYRITIVFRSMVPSAISGGNDASYQGLYEAVIAEISQEHVIYGIKNPYRCIIDLPQQGDIIEETDGSIIFKLTGHSYRIYKAK